MNRTGMQLSDSPTVWKICPPTLDWEFFVCLLSSTPTVKHDGEFRDSKAQNYLYLGKKQTNYIVNLIFTCKQWNSALKSVMMV